MSNRALLSTLVLFFVAGPLLAKDSWVEVRSPNFTVLSNAGEHEGRRIALQFEEVRALFAHLYPKLRVDSGKPTIVFALRNEDSLKLLIPSYGQNSKAMHLAGFYHQGNDKNYAIIRTDVTGVGPLSFHSLYHEYTHAFFRYNYRSLPLWLDEGLAEFYGNTSISSKDASVGLPNEDQLRYLQSNHLLPIDQLVTIDNTSPLYNTSEHAGIFYAESWALVHYLSISEDVRSQDLLNKFLVALHASDDPIASAKQTFGDLKGLSERLEAYVRQISYHYEHLPLQSKMSEKDFAARSLTPAEASLAIADYLLRSNHLPEALERLHEVEGLDPATRGYHSEWGHYHLAKADFANAEKELQLAIAADPDDLSAHMDMAYLYLRRDGYSKESTPKIRIELEKAVEIAPDFPPAYAFLSIGYAQEPNKDPNKALKAANRASELQPGNLAYFLDIGKALLAGDRVPEARKIAETAKKLATTTGDRNQAAAFARQIESAANHRQEIAATKASDPDAPRDTLTAEAQTSVIHAEGRITELLCGHPPEVLLTLTTADDSILLHVVDIGKISIQDGPNTSDATQSPCSKWKDRHVKLDYRDSPSGMAKGEIQGIVLD